MKILEIEEFSAGIGGVSSRVIQESRELVKQGFKVTIFSSDITEGTGARAASEELIDGISIRRFPAKNLFFSKNVNYFDFSREFEKLKPDYVIVHTIHPHSFKALDLCLKNKTPCYLVTHAPFNVRRNPILALLTKLYYSFSVKPKINRFTKIITITKWEEVYLEKLGVVKDKIVCIPNGIPSEFFSQKRLKSEKKVLFLGRIAPVKALETLILAAKLTPEIKFHIVGMAEPDYLKKLKEMFEKENITNVKIFPPVFNLKDKIELIDKHSIFVLPSKREAMPQSLIESMARGKLVISSDTDGGKELIVNKKTGFLFKKGKFEDLAVLIKNNISGNKDIEKNAAEFARQFDWNILVKKYLSILK